MEKKKISSLQWIYSYSRSSLGWILLLAVFSGLIAGSFILLALVSSCLLDIATGSREGSVWLQVLFLVMLILLQAVLNIASSNLRIRVTTKIEMRIKQGVFSMILKKQYQEVSKIHSGEILNRLTSDVDIVVGGVVSLIPQAISMLTKIAAGLFVLFSIDARFTGLVLLIGGLVCVFSRIYSRHFKYLHKEVQRTNGIVRSYMQECLENLIVIKSFVNEHAVGGKLDEFQKDNYKVRIKRNTISNLANTMVYVLFTAGYYAALAWGALQISVGIMTFGTLTAFLQIIQQIKAPFRNVSGLIPQYYSMQASAERLMELEAMIDEQAESKILDAQKFYKEFHAIVAEKVTFSYAGGEPVLENTSLRVQKGDLIAIVGESGIGKSTLMKLLLHLMPCDSGKLYFETECGKVEIDAGTRTVFSYVPQGNMIMSGTIRENITFCNPKVTDEEIQRAARAACIWDYIETLPNGLDTVLSERGERGNEMTQVLEEFTKLGDPKSGNPLMDRTTLIANTSNMPVAAREASIYTGLTLAEYYRDMGYDVAIMADSTSRWAEALRELSGRLEEMPAEEGFPAYLASRLSAFYERAGMMHNLNGTDGSVSIIGAVSPQGGDFSEPVTQNTKRFVRCFWGLDKSLAYARHFPAIHWLTSYSEYLLDLAPWYNEHVSPKFVDYRNQLMALLNQESSLMEIVKLIGSDVLPDDQKLVLEIAKVIRLGFLQQNAFHADDTCVSLEKQFKMMEVILYLYQKSKALITLNMPISVLKEEDIFEKVIAIKYDVPNDKLELFDEYMKKIDAFYDRIMEKNA